MNKVMVMVAFLILAVSVLAPPPPPPPIPAGFGEAESTVKSTAPAPKTSTSAAAPTFPATKLTVEERLSALEGRVDKIEEDASGISAPTWILIIIDLVLVGLVLYIWKSLQPREPGY